MPDPISNNEVNPCGKEISAACVPWNGPAVPCLNICKTDSVEDVAIKEGNLLCNMVSDLNSWENPQVIDFSALDLKCLWSPTITTYICPCKGTELVQPVNGDPPYCQTTALPHTVIIGCDPVPVSTTPNPIPKPTTLLGVLQLILDKIPCCDPCSGKSDHH